ncbi:L-asparaginase [Chelonia mydas]|uniref:L-asparaginase n=1 Tax=Chelonia mydas TaxID=8469 RepID=M7BJ46_CHEMY|nr:L-asparaginase [Chelonia mydas]
MGDVGRAGAEGCAGQRFLQPPLAWSGKPRTVGAVIGRICGCNRYIIFGDLVKMGTNPVLVVHGGAWAIPDEFAERSILGVKNAVKSGFAVLEMGGSSMKAVEIAVQALEDDTVFDAVGANRYNWLALCLEFRNNSIDDVKEGIESSSVLFKRVDTDIAADLSQKVSVVQYECFGTAVRPGSSNCHGAVLNADGYVELDAIIMNGKTLAAGAVSCIRNISNPVTFACSVLEKTHSCCETYKNPPDDDD